MKNKRKSILQLDPFLTAGIIISIALALVLVLLGQDEVSSLITGFLITIITILIDLIARLRETETRVLEAVKLGNILSENEELHSVLSQIALNYSAVQNKDFDLFTQRSQDALLECKEVLVELDNGYLNDSPGGKYAYGRKGIRNAQSSVKVIDYENIAFWRTENAKNILKVNAEAIKRGVEIQRIFIISNENLLQSKDVLQSHKDVGVKVLVVSPDDLPSAHLLENYLIIDGQVLVYFYYARDGIKLTGEKICINRVDVDAALNKFDAIVRRSKPF